MEQFNALAPTFYSNSALNLEVCRIQKVKCRRPVAGNEALAIVGQSPPVLKRCL